MSQARSGRQWGSGEVPGEGAGALQIPPNRARVTAPATGQSRTTGQGRKASLKIPDIHNGSQGLP